MDIVAVVVVVVFVLLCVSGEMCVSGTTKLQWLGGSLEAYRI